MYNTRNMGKDSLCNTKRKLGVEVKTKDKSEFLKTRVARKAVNAYKLGGSSISEVIDLINNEMKEIPLISEITRKLQQQEVEAVVTRYLAADPRRAKHDSARVFYYMGEKLSVCPDFIYEEDIDGVRHVEIVDFTTGRQKYVSGRSRDREFNSIQFDMEGLGMLLYGRSLLPNGTGAVRITYDALKTTRDTNGDYSSLWQCQTAEGKSKMTDNRCFITVSFEEGIVTSSSYYDIFDSYEESFKLWQKGKDTCSKDTCSKCELNELCHYNHRPVAKDQKVIVKNKINNLSVSPEQQKIVDFTKGICVVDAGPGSGKTHTMAVRIAKLLSEGVSPDNIIIISFSRAAIKVIIDRVQLIVNEAYGLPVDTSRIKIASFNSLGNEIIKKYHTDLGFANPPELCDGIESYDMVLKAIDWEDEIEGLDYRNPHMEFNANVIGVGKFIKNEIEFIRNNNLTADSYFDIASKEKKLSDESIVKIWETYERYQELMTERGYIDYSDQSNMVDRLMNIAPEYVTEFFRYEHIIVDEFQDSNDFQLRFLCCLMQTAKFKSLMVVGDESQSIFGFRGTSPENIVDFGKKIGEEVTTLYLSTNYRSTEEIVTACNDYIQKNGYRHPMTSGRGLSGNKPVLKGFEDKKLEINYITSKIEELINDGVKPEEIAVICGKRVTLKAISKKLSEKNILSQFDMPEYMLDNSRVMAAIGFAEFVSDTTATKGLMDYLNEIYDFLGTSFKSNMGDIIEVNREGFVEIWDNTPDADKKDLFISFLNLIDDDTDNIYKEFVKKITDKKAYGVSEIISYILKMREYNVRDTGEKEGEFEAISLVTAHSSKGKEWKYVFGSLSDFANQGIRLSQEEIREKRRLVYVMMSRAKDFLAVTSCRYADRKTDEVREYNYFFSEIDSMGCFDKVYDNSNLSDN